MDMGWDAFLPAFLLSMFAGLSTVLGCVFIFKKKISKRFLSVALGFSAGVMIYVSFVELLGQAREALSPLRGGDWYLLLSFFGGIALIAVIDRIIPEANNPHDLKSDIEKAAEPAKEDGFVSSDAAEKGNTILQKADGQAVLTVPHADLEKSQKKKMMRTGILSFVVIAIHNFPEGLATFTAASQDLSLGIAIAVAVAIHNIPEGITIALPIYEATGSRKRAFWYTFASGIFEPLGALLGFLILSPFINETFMGVLFAVISGIMVFISLDELLPAAREYGHSHLAIYGLIAGMLVMGISLVLL